ncbi:MAG: peptide chain release factor N(5)-glutamine methyltransferase [SAR202 cluster bacterium]|nr:peptide chain release factor N(5)-glutamine methyltransferase [SAR202 cluster bacterium]
MTIAQWLLDIRQALLKAGISEEEAWTESELILRETLGLDRTQLHLQAMESVSSILAEKLEHIVSCRAKREPLAYIFGHWPFYGLDIIVTPDVLIPRPETEGLVEIAMALCRRLQAKKPSRKVVDVGTGSGAVAVVLAKEAGLEEVMAADSSREALGVAHRNLCKYGLGHRVKLLEGDLLEPIASPLDLIIANLPYIPTSRLPNLQPEVRWEPRQALDGGPDGLNVIKRMLMQAKRKLAAGGSILLEIDEGQSEPLKAFSKDLFPNAAMSVEKDLAGLDRYFLLESDSLLD